jgi:hypothetical protein
MPAQRLSHQYQAGEEYTIRVYTVQACFDLNCKEFNKAIYNMLTRVSHTLSKPRFLSVTLSDLHCPSIGLVANGDSFFTFTGWPL